MNTINSKKISEQAFNETVVKIKNIKDKKILKLMSKLLNKVDSEQKN